MTRHVNRGAVPSIISHFFQEKLSILVDIPPHADYIECIGGRDEPTALGKDLKMTLSFSQFKKQIAKFDMTKAEVEEAIDRFLAQSDRDYDRDWIAREISGYITYLETPASAASKLARHAGIAESLNKVPATAKQIDYLGSLLEDIGDEVEWHLDTDEPLTKALASDMISRLA